MRHIFWFSAFLISFSLLLLPAHADQWITKITKDRNGKSHASFSIKQDGIYLSFSCAASQKKHDLHMVMLAESFPNLYSVDDAVAKLTFRFNLPNGVTFKNSMKAWYYGGDKAWTGPFPVDSTILKFFADAQSITLLNPEGKEVKTFSMKGSSKAAKAARDVCMSELR